MGIASSADGGKLAAIANGGGIYTWQVTPPPQLILAASTENLAILWTVPSTNFVLQESFNLAPGSWTTLANPPVLNLTNLQEQMTVLPTNGNAWFRLVTHLNEQEGFVLRVKLREMLRLAHNVR